MALFCYTMLMHQITEQSFYKYVRCPSWLNHEMDGEGDLRDPLMIKLQDEGLLRERELDLLKDREVTEVKSDDMDEAAQETLEMMKRGIETIYKGVLIKGHWVGRPDILEKVEGDSGLGDYYYIACDIKRSRHLKDEYKFQGSFYADILEKVQGMKPVQGYVLHANGRVSSYLLEAFETEYSLTLDGIEDILDGKKKPHFLTSSCKQSPWFDACQSETLSCDSLSTINRIWRSEISSLIAGGITSVTELANATPDAIKQVSGVTSDRLYFLQQQANALIDNKVIRMGDVDLPEEDGIVLVIDIESDPLRDLDYLFGVLVVDGQKEEYHAFTAKKPEDEEKNWHKFTAFLEQYSQANIYHYGWYEQEVFKKKVEMYGAPEAVKEQFEKRMVDVIVAMREKVIFPTPFYSLKDIAKHLGFKWRIADASGLDSVIWYQEWLAGDKSALKDIVEYNEDDVRATWLVRNWALETSERL
jgi:predicted RecB family nuclease